MALSFARPTNNDKNIIKKSKTVTTRTSIKSGGNNLAAQIQSIVAIANQKLAIHKDDYILIREPDQLYEYMKEMKQVGEGALDTETTGLNPLLVDIVGGCIYTPGQKAAYIPINHKSYITGVRTKDQLDEQTVSKIMKEFHNDIRWVFHNAKYDIRVCRKTLGIDFKPYWDTMLAAYCIDEEESHRLKDLHLKYCNSKDTESLTFDTLFNGVTFDNIPISTAYLYAAGDAVKTYELYEYQKTLLNRRVLTGPYNVFWNIEMPLISVVADMEDRGVCLDFDVCKNLHEKYHKIREERQKQADEAIAMYQNEIDNYKATDENIIDFNNSKSIQDIINAKNKYLQMESTILTSADNITTPIDHPDDSPEMMALKEAIRSKHIDINKYEQRFGPNFNNDRRLLDKNSITLAKLKTMANALDMDISLTIKDKPGNIPNPIGKVITVSVTDEFRDELEEKGDQ